MIASAGLSPNSPAAGVGGSYWQGLATERSATIADLRSEIRDIRRTNANCETAHGALLEEHRQRAIDVSIAHETEKQIMNAILKNSTHEWTNKLLQAEVINHRLSINVSEKSMTCYNLRKNNIILPHALFGAMLGCLVLTLVIIIVLIIWKHFKRLEAALGLSFCIDWLKRAKAAQNRNPPKKKRQKQTEKCAINAKAFKWWPSIKMTREGNEGNKDLFEEGKDAEAADGEELYGGHTTQFKKSKLNNDLIKELELTMKMKK